MDLCRANFAADLLDKQTFTKPIDQVELRAFFGLIYLAGLFKSENEDATGLFASDGTGRDIFRATMNLKRFLYIEACLRFDDPSTRLARGTPLAPIFDIYEQFVGNCSKLYSPSDIVTIDEMLIGFRGRCHFRMYIPTIPNKYSIKMQCLADARTFYLCDAFLYCGTETKLL